MNRGPLFSTFWGIRFKTPEEEAAEAKAKLAADIAAAEAKAKADAEEAKKHSNLSPEMQENIKRRDAALERERKVIEEKAALQAELDAIKTAKKAEEDKIANEKKAKEQKDLEDNKQFQTLLKIKEDEKNAEIKAAQEKAEKELQKVRDEMVPEVIKGACVGLKLAPSAIDDLPDALKKNFRFNKDIGKLEIFDPLTNKALLGSDMAPMTPKELIQIHVKTRPHLMLDASAHSNGLRPGDGDGGTKLTAEMVLANPALEAQLKKTQPEEHNKLLDIRFSAKNMIASAKERVQETDARFSKFGAAPMKIK